MVQDTNPHLAADLANADAEDYNNVLSSFGNGGQGASKDLVE